MLSILQLESLMLVAALVALGARRLRLPYTVGLLLAGTAIASMGLLKDVALTKELLFGALLPPLIFEAAVLIRWKELRPDLAQVLTLASLGVVVGGSIVAISMVSFALWPWPVALVFGSLIAATDPVSVIAMFKEVKVGGRLRLLVEAESLFNDGVAAVLFSIALMLSQGQALTGGLVALSLLREVGGGLLAGSVVAGVTLLLARGTDDHLIEMTFSTVAAFGAYLLAERFHCSGVLAVLTAGLMIGNLGHFGSISDTSNEALGAFWEFGAFVANSIVFLLIGMQQRSLGSLLVENWTLIVLAVLACLIGRAVSVYGVLSLFGRSKNPVEPSQKHILWWGGLRGALSLALAIGLPDNFPLRDQVVSVTFGVVAFSVFVQGLSMPWLMRKLGLRDPIETHPYRL